MEDIWNNQYNGKIFYSHETNHSCGVMILIKDLEFEFKSSVLDTKGRYILIDARDPTFYCLIFTHLIRLKSNANFSAV